MNTLSINEDLFSAETAEPGIVTVRLKRHLVEHLSSLSHKEGLLGFLDRIAGDHSVKSIIIFGNPERRGAAEIEEWHERIVQLGIQQDTIYKIIHAFQQFVRHLLTQPQIVLHGDSGALTSHYLSIGLAADYFALGDCVRIINTNVRHNMIPAGGAAFLLANRVGRQTALSLMANRDEILAEEAKSLGICHDVFPARELEARLIEKAREFTPHSLDFLGSLKEGIRPDISRLDEWFARELMFIVRDAVWRKG